MFVSWLESITNVILPSDSAAINNLAHFDGVTNPPVQQGSYEAGYIRS